MHCIIIFFASILHFFFNFSTSSFHTVVVFLSSIFIGTYVKAVFFEYFCEASIIIGYGKSLSSLKNHH